MAFMGEALDNKWTDEVETAWATVVGVIISKIKDGLQSDE